MLYSTKMLSLAVLVTSLVLQGCGGGSSTPAANTPPAAADTTPPSITLQGSATINHEQGTAYTDDGATANDAKDGSVAVTTSGTVGTAAGTYTLTYSATDAAGNNASITRTVIVADTTDPVITLSGEAAVSLEEGTAYTEAGALATDTVDSSVDVVVTGSVGTAVGSYVVTYTATDTAGNSVVATRTVTVTATDTGTEPSSDDTFILTDGAVAAIWGGDAQLSFFDSTLGYGDADADCTGTEVCDSVDWEVVTDSERGNVLQVSYTANAGHAGLVVGPTTAVDLSDYAAGSLSFDIKLVNAANVLAGGFFLKVESGTAISGELPVPGIVDSSDWQTINFPVSSLTASGALNLSAITAPMVFSPPLPMDLD